MESSPCFMCGQQSEKFHFISETKRESELSISYIICKHFWFQEDALQMAIICEPCWQKVDQFHCYYEDVRQHHEQLVLEPSSIFIKQEEIEIVEEGIANGNCEGEGKDSLDGGNHVEVTEECNKLSLTIDQVFEKLTPTPKKIGRKRELSSTKKKSIKKKSSEGQVVKKLPRNKLDAKQRELIEQKRLEEDSFIKQHLTYGCEECSVKFENFISIRRHMIDVHDKPYIMCCGVRYTARGVLFQHVQAVLNPEAFRCELCDKTFKLNISYITHKQRYHRNNEPLKCDQCPKQFSTENKLNRHIVNHQKEKARKEEKHICEVCSRCFNRKASLKNHMVYMHEKNTVYVCEICSKTFTRKPPFLEHLQTHEFTAEELKKQCPVCKKWQKNLRLWKAHMTRHNAAGASKCDQCDHVSVNSLALKEHVERRHQKKQRCVCDLCGKVYGHPVTLKEHVANAHTKEPLYKCKFCERMFFSNASMYAHRKKAHPKEWQEYHRIRYGINMPAEDKKDKSSI
nr:transcription factor grauzone-like [Aedes albopictus]